MLVIEHRQVIYGLHKIENAITALYGQVADQDSGTGGRYKITIDEYKRLFHYLMRLYFLRICISLSKGRASTVQYLLPFVVFAASRELMMASSVASKAAINRGDVKSLCNTGAVCTGPLDSFVFWVVFFVVLVLFFFLLSF